MFYQEIVSDGDSSVKNGVIYSKKGNGNRHCTVHIWQLRWSYKCRRLGYYWCLDNLTIYPG